MTCTALNFEQQKSTTPASPLNNNNNNNNNNKHHAPSVAKILYQPASQTELRDSTIDVIAITRPWPDYLLILILCCTLDGFTRKGSQPQPIVRQIRLITGSKLLYVLSSSTSSITLTRYLQVNRAKCNVSLRGDRAYITIVIPNRIPYHSKFFEEYHSEGSFPREKDTSRHTPFENSSTGHARTCRPQYSRSFGCKHAWLLGCEQS